MLDNVNRLMFSSLEKKIPTRGRKLQFNVSIMQPENTLTLMKLNMPVIFPSKMTKNINLY